MLEPRNVADLSYIVYDILTEDEWSHGGEPEYFDRFEHYVQWCDRHARTDRVLAQDQILLQNTVVAHELLDTVQKGNFLGCTLRNPVAWYNHGHSSMIGGPVYEITQKSMNVSKSREAPDFTQNSNEDWSFASAFLVQNPGAGSVVAYCTIVDSTDSAVNKLLAANANVGRSFNRFTITWQ